MQNLILLTSIWILFVDMVMTKFESHRYTGSALAGFALCFRTFRFVNGLQNIWAGDTDAVLFSKLSYSFLTEAEKEPWGRLNKKDGLTRYGNSHVKDKTS